MSEINNELGTTSTSSTNTASQLPIYTVTELNYGIASSGPSTPVPVAATGSLYKANVLLPLMAFNLNLSTDNYVAFKQCPVCNEAPTVYDSTTLTYTNNLTKFGSMLLNFIVNEFNTLYGTDFKTDQFAIMSQGNDQNSVCGYEVYSASLNITINVWTQVGNESRADIRFIDAI